MGDQPLDLYPIGLCVLGEESQVPGKKSTGKTIQNILRASAHGFTYIIAFNSLNNLFCLLFLILNLQMRKLEL